MNLFECIGGGSSELQETVLWTNSSPTSNFGGQDVAISDSVSNYDYIKIYYRISTSVATTAFAIWSSSDFATFTDGNNIPFGAIGGRISSSYRNYRRIYYNSGTQKVSISACYNSSGSNTDTYIVPTSICGLKYASPKPSGTETVLWTNSSVTSSMSETTVTLSDSIENYRLIKFEYYKNTSNTTSNDLRTIITDKTTLKGSIEATINAAHVAILSSNGGNTVQYARRIWYISPTSLKINTPQGVNTQATSATTAIPYRIIGIS